MIGGSLRYVSRVLAKSLRSVLPVVAILGLSVGTTAAVVALVDSYVFNPVPSDHGRQIMAASGLVFATPEESGLVWWGRAKQLKNLSTYFARDVILDGADTWRPVPSAIVSGRFFGVFRVEPVLGRLFVEGDEDRQPHGVAVVSHTFWRDHNKGRSALGRPLSIGGVNYQIVGVAPEGFDFPAGTQLWLAGRFGGPATRLLQRRRASIIATSLDGGWVGRLAAGAGMDDANRELSGLNSALKRRFPASQFSDRVSVRPLAEQLSRNIGPALQVFFAGSVLVLVVASINAGILLSVLLTARVHEIAILLALGATRRELVTTVLVGGLVLWGVTSSFGTAVALLILRLTEIYSPLFALHAPAQQTLTQAAVEGAIVSGAVAICIALLIPLLQGRRVAVAQLLRGSIEGRWGSNALRRHVFSSMQVAVALLLVIAAFSSTRTLIAFASSDPGFEPRDALVIESSSTDVDPQQSASRRESALRALQTTAGISAVGLSDELPIRGRGVGLWFGNGKEAMFCQRYLIDGDYLRAMGIDLVAGRGLRAGERDVVLISQGLARRLSPTGPAYGFRVRSLAESRGFEVVGITEDVPMLGADAATSCQVYLPYSSQIEAAQARAVRTFVIVRCAGPCSAVLASGVRATLQSETESNIGSVTALDDLASDTLGPLRFRALLSIGYAVLGASLAILGIYALVSQIALQRAPEIGVHKIAGANRRDIVMLVVGKSFVFTVLGVLAGCLGAFLFWQTFSALFFGAAPPDLQAILVAAAVLLVCGGAAALVPALRLSRESEVHLLRIARGSRI